MPTASTVKYYRINEVFRSLLKFCLSAIKVLALIMVSTVGLAILLILFFNMLLIVSFFIRFIGF